MTAGSQPGALRVVVMGVSGCGKTTVGELLAARLAIEFLEGDALHPRRNIERMAAGIALTDDDRRGWLEAIAQRLAAAYAAGSGLVVSCSALKRKYRDTLRGTQGDLFFVYLQGDRKVLEARVHGRPGHFMAPSLLHSQLDTLEVPQADERSLTCDAAQAPALIVAEAAAWLTGVSAARSDRC